MDNWFVIGSRFNLL